MTNQRSNNDPEPDSGKQKVAEFESNLNRLEEIVLQLEQGNLPLDASLRLYEDGIKAYKQCSQLLQKAESRVTQLIETLEGELKEDNLHLPEEEGQ